MIHLLASVSRVYGGFALAADRGAAAGHADRPRAAGPATARSDLQILRPVPVTAWLPLAMIIFGLGPRSAFFLVFLGAFYPILVNTIFGVRSVEPRLFEAAAMLGCTGPAQFFRVVLPAALPSIFTGLRLGLGFAWVVIVVGEMTGVQTGLGAIIMEARQLSRTEIVISGMIVIGVFGFLSDQLVMLIGTPAAGLESRRMAEATIPILEMKNVGKTYAQNGRADRGAARRQSHASGRANSSA